MINVYVNSKTIDLKSLHENCYTILKPSTMIHIAHKLLHLAATNNSDGGHYNTRFHDRIINFQNFKSLDKIGHKMENLLELCLR